MTDSGPLLSRDCHHRGAAARRTSRDRGAVPGARRLVREARLNGSGTGMAFKATTAPRKRKFSPEARRRMREAQQRRWAKVRGEAEPSAPPPPNPPRRNGGSARREGRPSRRRSGGVGRRSERLLRLLAKKNSAPKKPAKAAGAVRKRAPNATKKTAA